MKKLFLFLLLLFIGLGSGNALTEALSLSRLSITGASLEPSFNSNITFYRSRVKNNITDVTINAALKDKNSTVLSGVGSKQKIIVGNNRFEIKIRDVNKSESVYVLVVSREDEYGNIPSHTYSGLLKELKLDEYTLYFSPKEFNYDIEVPNGITKLTINAKALESDLQLEILGNENFIVGNNIVLINVKSGSNIIRTYTLNVTRLDALEESKEKNIYYMLRNSDEDPIKIQLEVPQIMSGSVLEYLTEAKKNVIFEYLNNNNKVSHSLELNYEKIYNNSMDINLQAELITDYKYKEKDALLLDLKQETFPGTVKVNINVKDLYKTSQVLELYKKKGNNLTKTTELKISNDIVSFATAKGGEYVMVPKDETKIKKQEQMKQIIIISGLGLLNLIALIMVIKVIRRK